MNKVNLCIKIDLRGDNMRRVGGKADHLLSNLHFFDKVELFIIKKLV